jgi:glycosyltransferase involved in cell wall biosynthesis
MARRSRKRKPIEIIPNGCDLEIFHPSHGPNDGGGQLVPGFPSDGLRCVFTGAHGRANGLDAVLDAASVLRSRGRSDIHLVFIGDGKLKPQLVARCEREKLTNCHFLDPVPKRQLSTLMSQTDVSLMILANVPAFYYGTSPNKFFDYISAGLPVVNNYPGWLADMIGQHECGIAVPPENPAAFAEALIRLADDPDLRRRMGRNARRLAETEFNRLDLANRLVDFLESIVSQRTDERAERVKVTVNHEYHEYHE